MADTKITEIPVILITMGDPAGIGPEIIVKALFKKRMDGICPVIIGDRTALTESAKRLGVNLTNLNTIKRAERAYLSADKINFLPVAVTGLGKPEPGQHNKNTGKAAIAYLEKALSSILMKEADAMVTGPLSKKAINEGGYYYNGHTDYLAEKTNTSKYAMCFYTNKLKVALVSDHVPLRKVHTKIKIARVLRTIFLLDEFLRVLGVRRPKIAVLGLNPHSGESGLLGAEELTEIIPAVNTALERGFNVFGPVTAEMGIRGTLKGDYDGAVAMYHDQGILPFKILAPYETVNITLGLPFIRTSAGHGTAQDIAGADSAKEDGIVKAIQLAKELVLRRRETI